MKKFVLSVLVFLFATSSVAAEGLHPSMLYRMVSFVVSNNETAESLLVEGILVDTKVSSASSRVFTVVAPSTETRYLVVDSGAAVDVTIQRPTGEGAEFWKTESEKTQFRYSQNLFTESFVEVSRVPNVTVELARTLHHYANNPSGVDTIASSLDSNYSILKETQDFLGDQIRFEFTDRNGVTIAFDGTILGFETREKAGREIYFLIGYEKSTETWYTFSLPNEATGGWTMGISGKEGVTFGQLHMSRLATSNPSPLERRALVSEVVYFEVYKQLRDISVSGEHQDRKKVAQAELNLAEARLRLHQGIAKAWRVLEAQVAKGQAFAERVIPEESNVGIEELIYWSTLPNETEQLLKQVPVKDRLSWLRSLSAMVQFQAPEAQTYAEIRLESNERVQLPLTEAEAREIRLLEISYRVSKR